MFVGRQKEILEIKGVIASKTPRICVIYGRRRIGKSALIHQCVQGLGVFSFEGAEGQSKQKQIKNFQDQFNFQLGLPFQKHKASSWKEVLLELVKELKQKPRPVIIDEFQWMANYRKELVSELKIVWDQYLSRIEGVSLILCGSIASFMIKSVIKSSALYGRVHTTIHLKAFNIKDTMLMLPQRGVNEILEAQLYTSGVPYYIQLMSESASIRLSLEGLAFKPTGYWVSEFQKIFISHFGENSLYRQIIETLSKHPYGMYRDELISKVNSTPGGNFSKLLFDLEEAGFITSWVPLDKGANSRLIKYLITDGFLRFYFSFINPGLKDILAGNSPNIFQNVTQAPAFWGWLGRSFELLCLRHARELAEIMGFSGIEYSAGPYFKRSDKNNKGIQIDLAYNRKDNVITFCEMKYRKGPVGLDIIDEVENKDRFLQKHFPHKTIQKVLVTLSPPTRELVGTGFFWKIIQAEELLGG
jgi:AAA+ ATPase superfamily predicted ATPase